MRIGDYEIRAEIARGGFGVVYRAFDDSLQREVAIKLLLADGKVGSYEQRRFTREARALGRLSHPNIVSVLGCGREGKHPYLVMRLVEGEPLDQRLDRLEVLAPAEAVGIAIKLARALAHAHAALILHRDVKPANVIVTPGGEPLLTDFGLAKDLAPSLSGSISIEGRFMGTPGYWPPEQALGQLHKIGAPADLYALGATLYACLTGVPPRSDESIAQALGSLEVPIPGPSTLQPGVDPALDRIVLGCLEHEPGDRYATAADLAEDLERWLRGERPRGPDASARSGTRWVGISPLSESRTWPLVAVGGVVSALVIGGAVWFVRRPVVAPPQPAVVASPQVAPTPRVDPAQAAKVRLATLQHRARQVAPFDAVLAEELEAAAAEAPALISAELRRLLRRYCVTRGRYGRLLEIPPNGDPGPHRLESLYLRAAGLKDRGQRRAARTLLQRLAVEEPKHWVGQLAAAVLEAKQRRWTVAAVHTEGAAALAPEAEEVLLFRLQLLHRRGRDAQAVREEGRAQSALADDHRFHYVVARALSTTGETEGALRRIEVAARLTQPTPTADIQLARAKSLFNLGRHREALEAVDVLARQHPTRSVDADVIAGVILSAGRRPEAARARWRAAYERSPSRFLKAVKYHPPRGMQAAIRRAVLDR